MGKSLAGLTSLRQKQVAAPAPVAADSESISDPLAASLEELIPAVSEGNAGGEPDAKRPKTGEGGAATEDEGAAAAVSEAAEEPVSPSPPPERVATGVEIDESRSRKASFFSSIAFASRLAGLFNVSFPRRSRPTV